MMKKEFKAPIIEIRQLSAADSVMAGNDIAIFASAEGRNGKSMTDSNSLTTQYSAWQGFTE